MDCILAELSIQCLWAYSRELLICAILVRAWAWHCSAQALLGYDSAAHAKLCYLGRTDAIPCSTRCYLRSNTECIVGNASLGQLGGPAARTSRNHVPFSAKRQMHRCILEGQTLTQKTISCSAAPLC